MQLPPFYELKHPIETRFEGGEAGGRVETIDRVPLRRLKGKDLRVIDQLGDKPMALTFALIAKMTDLEIRQVDELDAEDVECLGEFVEAITPGGRKTGPTGSEI